jgi:RuvB-like protein 2
MEKTLRYAMHLITTANLIAQKRKSTEIDMEDISRVFDLFIDVERSKKFLHEFEKEFMFSEIETTSNNKMDLDK